MIDLFLGVALIGAALALMCKVMPGHAALAKPQALRVWLVALAQIALGMNAVAEGFGRSVRADMQLVGLVALLAAALIWLIDGRMPDVRRWSDVPDARRERKAEIAKGAR